MPILKILILLALLLIVMQDLKYRSVYWWMFPMVICFFTALRFLENSDFSTLWQPVVINIGLVLLQLSLLSVYFSFKYGRIINIINSMLGWGDVLFFISICFYLSVLNFAVFYIGSLFLVLLVCAASNAVYKTKSVQIPLAGLQALLLSVYLSMDWYCVQFHATDDTWLLNLMYK